MRRGQRLLAVLVLTVAFALLGSTVAFAAAATPLPPAQHFDLAGAVTPGTPLPILANPYSPLQAALMGTSGTYEGRVLFTPLLAPPPAISDGFQENSRFTVKGFSGMVIVQGPAAMEAFGESPHVLLMTMEPADLSLQVHFGTQPSTPNLTLLSDEDLLYFPDAVSTGTPVRLLQVVGMEVVVAK